MGAVTNLRVHKLWTFLKVQSSNNYCIPNILEWEVKIYYICLKRGMVKQADILKVLFTNFTVLVELNTKVSNLISSTTTVKDQTPYCYAVMTPPGYSWE